MAHARGNFSRTVTESMCSLPHRPRNLAKQITPTGSNLTQSVARCHTDRKRVKLVPATSMPIGSSRLAHVLQYPRH